jgi:hypothetical protein
MGIDLALPAQGAALAIDGIDRAAARADVEERERLVAVVADDDELAGDGGAGAREVAYEVEVVIGDRMRPQLPAAGGVERAQPAAGPTGQQR